MAPERLSVPNVLALGPIGLLAIGQSPREDVEATFRSVLGADATFVHAGALDGLDQAGLAALAPREYETPNETRLRNGAAVVVADERIVPLLVERARETLSDCRGVLLLCTADFPQLREQCPEIRQPVGMLRSVVSACTAGQRLGVIGPTTTAHAVTAWRGIERQMCFAPASPYGPDADITHAARSLAADGCDALVLDCIGFTEHHRRIAGAVAGIPVICATTLVGRLLPELFQ